MFKPIQIESDNLDYFIALKLNPIGQIINNSHSNVQKMIFAFHDVDTNSDFNQYTPSY